jgi:hypothetical protein
MNVIDMPASDEIEVTEEMIEAGVDVIMCEVGGADLGGLFDASALASRVFLAMYGHRTKEPRELGR